MKAKTHWMHTALVLSTSQFGDTGSFLNLPSPFCTYLALSTSINIFVPHRTFYFFWDLLRCVLNMLSHYTVDFKFTELTCRMMNHFFFWIVLIEVCSSGCCLFVFDHCKTWQRLKNFISLLLQSLCSLIFSFLYFWVSPYGFLISISLSLVCYSVADILVECS